MEKLNIFKYLIKTTNSLPLVKILENLDQAIFESEDNNEKNKTQEKPKKQQTHIFPEFEFIDENHGVDLKELYRESGSEMRALRDTEFKIAALFYQMSAFLLAANIYIISSSSGKFYSIWIGLTFMILSIVFLTIFWLKTHERITADNAFYGWHLSLKRLIEEKSFKTNSVNINFPGKPPSLGNNTTGKGYQKTQGLIALTYLLLISMIFIGHILKIILTIYSSLA